jgi:hypothetical protein
VGQEKSGWEPLSREEFAKLQRGQQLIDRNGRVWMVVNDQPYVRDGWPTVVLRSGDLVRHVPDRWSDDYMLLR